MPFAVTTPGGNVVRLDDVPVEDLGKIADEAGVDSWSSLLTQPIKNWRATLGLYRYACAQHGETPPEKLLPKDIVKAFDWKNDDLPTAFEGGVPLEEAEDDPTTSGLPGVPSDSSGPPPSPEASPFENSNS